MILSRPAPLTPDPHDPSRVQAGPDLLRAFNDAGILGPADVHVAVTLGRLSGENDPQALLGVALAVRAPRFGHVCADLTSVRDTVTADEDVVADLDRLPWPSAASWPDVMARSTLVAVGAEAAGERPLRLITARLYLDRYWRYERRVVAQLLRRSSPPARVDTTLLQKGLERLFPPEPGGEQPDRQRLAAAAAILRCFAVIAGGPGTGKTTTVARVLALAEEQAVAAGQRPPRIALAAPTGKAAARLQESVRDTALGLPIAEEIRARLTDLEASTIHRLLGVRPATTTRFFHDRDNPLPHDLVVVDETSMVSLALMAKLIEAVRRDARVVLVGDPEQLASVEAGTVLGDIVGPASVALRMTTAARRALAEVSGGPVAVTDPPAGVTIGDGIVVLRRVHRFRGESGIAAFAQAVQRGDADRALGVLAEGRSDVRWVSGAWAPAGGPGREGPKARAGGPDVEGPKARAGGPDVEGPKARAGGPGNREGAFGAGDSQKALAPVRAAIVAAGTRLLAAARTGEAHEALRALSQLRVLCAHRRGPFGVTSWVAMIELWLARAVKGLDPSEPWYLGRPVLVTRNDYQLGIFNGDNGVVVALPQGRTAVAFEVGGELRLVSPTRLEAVETVHAMTVHKSQGSQFGQVVVVLPEADSPILTRELLYTAVTRARDCVVLVGGVEAVRSAIERPVLRSSGLRQALWGA